MRVLKSFAIKLAVLALLTLSPASVRGELFGDVYVGGAYTRDADSTVSIAGNRFTEHQDLGDSFTLGLRIG